MSSFSEEEIIDNMKKVISICEDSIKDGEVPVGCIFLHIGSKKIIASSHNLTNMTKDASRHCEINCLYKLEEIINDSEKKKKFIKDNNIEEFNNIQELFANSALFVSCEPCIMCAYALSIAGIKEVYYGCPNEKFGGNGSIMSIQKGPGKPYVSKGGYLKEECIEVLRKFYSRGNEKAPENKRQRKLEPQG